MRIHAMNLASARFQFNFLGFNLTLQRADQTLLHWVSIDLKLGQIRKCFFGDALECHCI